MTSRALSLRIESEPGSRLVHPGTLPMVVVVQGLKE